MGHDHDDEKHGWEGKGWILLISDFMMNINKMMAMKIRDKIREEKIKVSKKMIGVPLSIIGMLIFFYGLSLLVGVAIGALWSGFLIVGAALILFSAVLFKS